MARNRVTIQALFDPTRNALGSSPRHELNEPAIRVCIPAEILFEDVAALGLSLASSCNSFRFEFTAVDRGRFSKGGSDLVAPDRS